MNRQLLGLVPSLRGLPVLVGVILVFAIILLLLARTFQRQAYEARAAALLDHIEYVEELKLATYYFEEIVTIGTRDRVAKRVDHAKQAMAEAEARLIRAELDLARARVAHEEALAAFYADDTLLAGPRQQLEAARAHYALIDKAFWGAVTRALSARTDTFGAVVATAYVEWEARETTLAAAPAGRDRRAARGARDAAEKVLREAVAAEKAHRQRQRDRWLEAYHRELDLHKDTRRRLKSARDEARAYFEKQQRQYAEAQRELQARQETLIQAEEEYARAEAAGEALEPKLVVVVPVSVSGFVDMRNLAYQPLGGELGNLGDTLLVVLPEPQIDSVQIALEATENYDLARRIGFVVSEDGFYFEIFQQLQDALTELKVRVREKAMAKGLREETQTLAREYVSDFAGSLGYQVRFVPTFPIEAAGPAPLQFEADSLLLLPAE